MPAVVDVFLACTIAAWFVLELRQAFHQVRRARTAGPVSGWARAAT